MALSDGAQHRRQLTDEVAAQLRQSILAGELIPGASVRPEAIGAALDVSATPVREALHILRAEGFLELRPRRGFAVAKLDSTELRDTFEAHALIAGELAARAAERAEAGDISELRVIHARLKAAVASNQKDQLERRNYEFHRRLYEAARSPRLLWALSGFVKYVPRDFYSGLDGWPQTSADDHSAVLEAVVERQPERAREAMAEHVRHAAERLIEAFEGRRASKD